MSKCAREAASGSTRLVRLDYDREPVTIAYDSTDLRNQFVDETGSPLTVMRRWPTDHPLFMLHSGRPHPRWARWSMLGTPLVTYRFDGRSQWIGSPPAQLADITFTHDPLVDLTALVHATRLRPGESDQMAAPSPFLGGWIGYVSFDLGRVIESKAQHHGGAVNDGAWPLIEFGYCPSPLLFDNVEQRWVSEKSRFNPKSKIQNTKSRWVLDPLAGELSRADYMSMVHRTKEYITAGDIFQANIAQRFEARFDGSTRALCATALRRSRPWYGAYLESTHGCMLSLSPELFLQVDGRSRKVVTRPIKGTRPSSASRAQLVDSSKDAAELHMIIDLMRNDLGRVCEFGSVKVTRARTIETHPTVHHGVGEVTGTLRENVSIADLLRATFPGGSVTGAPKIRAMQIIDELEPVRRGPYCGAIGYISNCGNVCLSIAIRTMLVRGDRSKDRFDRLSGVLQYSAGAGIVADSDPESEYRETLDKTAVLRDLYENPATSLADSIN